MFLVLTQKSVLFVVKRVKTLRLDDLAITRGVNVFANSIKDQFAHLVAQFADQHKIALGFEQRSHESNVVVEYLYNSVAGNFLRTSSDAPLTFLKSINSEMASM